MAATATRKRKPRAITLGKGPTRGFDQRGEYMRAMQVKRGELVWCPFEHETRFGARGDYVTPERAAELAVARAVVAHESAPPRTLISAGIRGEVMVIRV